MKKKTILVDCRDEKDSLERLLEYIKKIAAYGHSFDIVVDPDDGEYRKKFFIDGDGADKIYSVEAREEQT